MRTGLLTFRQPGDNGTERRQTMVKQYQDVKVIDLQCIYEIQGDETVCDADKQQATIESQTYEWLQADKAKYGFEV
jgi:elongation factor P hydroxylase